MTIKERIKQSNMLMLVIPVVIIVGISTIIRGPFFSMVQSKMEDKYNKSLPGTNYVIDILRFDPKNSDNEEYFNNLPSMLEESLKTKGYHIEMQYDHKEIFSNLTEKDEQAISSIGSETLNHANSMVLELNKISLVKSSYFYKKRPVDIIAINSSYEHVRFDLKKHMQTYMITYASIVGILSILVITLTNSILTNKIAQSLIIPLDLLSNYAEKIKNGNLEFKCEYDKEDEFKKVFNDFDEMRARLKESVDTRIKYEENRKDLMAGISHDLRTPITAIKGYVEGLRDGVANTEEKQKKYLNIIFNKACHMDRLVEELFLFSKLDTGRFPFKFSIINIESYIEDFYFGIKEEFINRGLDIYYESYIDSKDLSAKMDIQQMHRVLVNIMENSCKYKKYDRGKAFIKLNNDNENVIIEIKDNGQGVKEEEIEKIFTSFYRCDPSRTKSSEGSGLGLAIAKQIIEGHKGKIEAYNHEGLGIRIYIPIFNK